MNAIKKIIIGLTFATLPLAKAADMPNALELLDKYAANQDKVISFIVKVERVATVKEPNEDKPDILRRDMEARVDGTKSRIFEKRWFDLPSRDAQVNIEDADMYDLLWDDDRYFTYRIGSKVDIEDENVARNTLKSMFSGVALFGIWYNYDERLDKELRKVVTISVRDKIEQVGSEKCYVIDAKTATGTYTVWFDPQHGYQIAKAEIRLGQGSRWRRGIVDEGESRFVSIQNNRFENIEGVWIPMETDIHEEEIVGPEPNQSWIIDTHNNINQITLNPNHEALGSFKPAIPNGTPVIDWNLGGILFTWQDGKLIPDVDEYAIEQIREMAQELKNQNKVPPGLITTEITETTTNDQITDANESTESQINANEGGREIQAQSRSVPFIVLTLISLSIIAIIGWKIFIRSKN